MPLPELIEVCSYMDFDNYVLDKCCERIAAEQTAEEMYDCVIAILFREGFEKVFLPEPIYSFVLNFLVDAFYTPDWSDDYIDVLKYADPSAVSQHPPLVFDIYLNSRISNSFLWRDDEDPVFRGYS